MPQTMTRSDEFAQRLESALKRTRAQPAETEFEADATPEAEPGPSGAGPVGDGDHVVRQGECTSSIARRSGHFWETLWNESGNAGLRAARKDPNVLFPGDRLCVPPLRIRYQPGATGQRHRFVRRGEPSIFRLRVLDDKRKPRGNAAYTLTMDEAVVEGVTDVDGVLAVGIPATARRGVLRIGSDSFELNLHALDPAGTVSGVQARLKNLGYFNGSVDGVAGPGTTEALRRYQRERGLAESGQLNDDTCETLRKEHRS